MASNADTTSVTLIAQGTLAPVLNTLASPPRVVVDLPNTVMATPYNQVRVDSQQVKGVRIGVDSLTPPTTRVVIDCLTPCRYEQTAGGRNQVLLKIWSTVAGASVARKQIDQNKIPAGSNGKKPSPAPPQIVSAEPAEPAYDQNTPGTGKYSGPGSCAASNCHGSVAPKTVTRVWQNEYSIWAAQDKHARAYAMLSNPVSMRMAKILKLQTNPNQADKCLVCHTLDVATNLRAQTFQMDEGVSCENCHGPAVGWLGPHTARGWTHEQSLKLGMYDTRDLVARSEKCMTCHVGTPEKRVDHEMIAAGHPDLTFELDTFSAVMPRHWKFPDNQNSWEGVQEWAIGQAVGLRETLNRLSRSASSNTTWPEFAELECFACHHSLTQPQDSWRQAAGYPGRKPGAPAWNAARYVVLRDLVAQINPDTGKQLDFDLEQISTLVGSWGDREKIAAAAKNASALANEMVQDLRRQHYDSNLTARIMQAIAGDGAIAQQGERSAEQAAMALDSLALAYQNNDKVANQTDLRAAIDRLFEQLNNSSAYNAPTFAAQMQKVKLLLPRGSQAADLRP